MHAYNPASRLARAALRTTTTRTTPMFAPSFPCGTKGRFASTTSSPPHTRKDGASQESVQYRSNAQSQGSVPDEEHNLSKRDVQSQAAKGARKTKDQGSGAPLDSASAEHGEKQRKPKDAGSGNPEGIGFVEQVGSGSGSANKFEGRE